MKRLRQRAKRIIKHLKEMPEYGVLVVPAPCSPEEWLKHVENPNMPTDWLLVGGGFPTRMIDNHTYQTLVKEREMKLSILYEL